MTECTVQVLLEGAWRDAARLEFPKPELGAAGPCYFEYEIDHVLAVMGRNAPLAAASVRLPVEIGPTCTKGPGSFLTHQAVLDALRKVLGPADYRDAVREYVRRDLLNVIFGNSDNHGRNTALLKTETSLRLAPVYDFAPMKMDPEGIIRTTRWETFEQGTIDWSGVVASFARDAEFVREGLHELAVRLVALPRLLADLGLPEQVLRFPALDLQGTETKLRAGGLL